MFICSEDGLVQNKINLRKKKNGCSIIKMDSKERNKEKGKKEDSNQSIDQSINRSINQSINWKYHVCNTIITEME